MISIILPTYNEAGNIISMIELISEQLQNAEYEIVVVDDNSTDGTINLVTNAMNANDNLKLFVRKSNRGLVQSIREGIANSVGEICIWMDADMSMSPQLINDIVYKINDGADLVVGSRYIAGGGMKGSHPEGDEISFIRILHNLSRSEDSIISALISKLGNRIIRLILNSSLHDFSSGYFGAKRATLKKLSIEGDIVDYCITLPYKAEMKGLNVVEIPMVLDTRKSGQSKTSNSILSILKIAYQCWTRAFILRFIVQDERGEI